MIQLRASGLIADAVDVEQRRREFHEVGWTRFPALLEPRLLQCVQEGLDHNPWDDYFKAGFDSNEILTPSPPLRLLQFVTNWPSFLALMAKITAAGPLTWFGGRVYRMRPGVGHHDDWHDDNIDGRLSAMSLNLGLRPYHGGLLQIRRRGADSPHVEIANTVSGDADSLSGLRRSGASRHRHSRDGAEDRICGLVQRDTSESHGSPACEPISSRSTLNFMTATPSLDSRIRINDDVLWQELQGEAVLLNLKTGVYFGLNPIGTRVWELLAATGMLRDVVDAIVGEYESKHRPAPTT
jgi:hypothetical protein